MNINKKSILSGISILAMTLSAPHAIAQDSSAGYSSFAEQAKAQKIIDLAIAAMGGKEAMNMLQNGKITTSTRAARIGQAPTPEANGDLGNPSKTIALRANGLVAIERFNGENLGSRYVHGGLVDWIYFVGNNSVADVEPVLAAGIIAQANTSAHIVLAMSNASQSARYVGSINKDGKIYDAVSFVDDLGRLQTAYFDQFSGLLHSVEGLAAHAQWGDIAITRTYADYKNVGGAMIAHTVTATQADTVASVTSFESFEAVDVDSAIFEKPKDATVNDPFTAPSIAPRDLTIETLAEGLYFIPNASQGYNILFADYKDDILLVETPQSIEAARDIIRTIKAKFPNKTIKYAVPTHHHFDHSGGLYGFHEAGITVLTTPGNVKFAREVGTTARNIGDSKGAITDAKVESFDGVKKFGKGANEVHLINVGPNPHAEEIVIAYIPAQKTVFMADVFSRRAETLPPANANQLAFADKLEELKLDIETFLPVHGTKTTAAEFWDSVKRGREAAADQ